jgi:hypothetical protein
LGDRGCCRDSGNSLGCDLPRGDALVAVLVPAFQNGFNHQFKPKARNATNCPQFAQKSALPQPNNSRRIPAAWEFLGQLWLPITAFPT